MTTLEQLLTGGLFAGFVGCYLYASRAVTEMRNQVDEIRDRQQRCEDGVTQALLETRQVLTDLTLKVSNRLTAIETRIGILLPKKGASGESI